MDNKDLKIKLLEMQVQALYSVLSEFDEDKQCFVQYLKAEAIKELLHHLEP